MIAGASSPSAYASSPLTVEDLDWAEAQDRPHPSTQEKDSQRTLKEDAKAAAFGVVILQSGQRDFPLSSDGVQSNQREQGLLKEQMHGQQHHQGDPFSGSSFTYMNDGAQKSLSTTAIESYHPSQLDPIVGVPSSPPYHQAASNSSQSYTPLSHDDERLHNELHAYLNTVGWQAEDGIDNGDQQKHQEQPSLVTCVKVEPLDGPLNMSAAGTPQSQLAVQASPVRPVSTTPTVYSTGAPSHHSQDPRTDGRNQGHLVPVTQVGDQFKYDPSRPTFTSNGTPATATQEVYGSNPISINQSNVRGDMRETVKSAMPAFGYQYMNQEGENDHFAYQNGQRVPMSAAPALGGGVTFLQLPGGGQQFYSYSQNGSPGVVVPTSMLQPGRVYGAHDQGSNQYANAKHTYPPSAGTYHPQSATVNAPAGYPTNMFYQGRSAGVEPPSAFQMVVSGSHDFFDQSALGHGRRPGMYQVKNEPMSDGMGEDEGENEEGDYEQERLRNIRRNQEMMEKLGLAGSPNRHGDMRSMVCGLLFFALGYDVD